MTRVTNCRLLSHQTTSRHTSHDTTRDTLLPLVRSEIPSPTSDKRNERNNSQNSITKNHNGAVGVPCSSSSCGHSCGRREGGGEEGREGEQRGGESKRRKGDKSGWKKGWVRCQVSGACVSCRCGTRVRQVHAATSLVFHVSPSPLPTYYQSSRHQSILVDTRKYRWYRNGHERSSD